MGMRARAATAEPPSETTRLRLFLTRGLCLAPLYVAEELLKAEGFTDLAYRPATERIAKALASGQGDLGMDFIGPVLLEIDAGGPLVILAGGHTGCHELFGGPGIRTVHDLKGRTVAVPSVRSGQHVALAAMLAHAGLDPRTDVNWVFRPARESVDLLAEGRVDALLSSPPEAQELRARRLGHVVVDTATALPWSRYFCCMVVGHREFVRDQRAATKRALRAILKAASVCALEPERVARFLVDGGLTPRYDLALQVMKEIPYGRWREHDPDETVRFYARRLHEAGMIQSSPEKLIAQGTDWRFLNELKRELKG